MTRLDNGACPHPKPLPQYEGGVYILDTSGRGWGKGVLSTIIVAPVSPGILCLLLAALLFLSAPVQAIRIQAPVTVQTVALNSRGDCSDAFISHQLNHITTPVELPIGFYDSNGAGLAVNDLDQDGWLDIVLANLGGDNAILWNEGGRRFRREDLPSRAPSRAAAIVDVDGDGWLDIVFTQQAAAPLYWRNLGGHFETQLLRGVSYIAYAMNWLDADRDGDLDLITGSYDVENELLLGQAAPLAGVVYYENLGERFRAARIGERSNTLAIHSRKNSAGESEIIIGNDFAVPDRHYVYRDGWQESAPPAFMPHSTMSYTAADLDNDGARELFAVDMKPYADDETTAAQWQPIMEMMMAMPQPEDDPQIMENVLYAGNSADNLARDYGLDGTGWSWSAKFGDLDNDGFQDLYAVNGMISLEMFSHLPENELVEANQVYRNLAGGGFQAEPGWALNDRASGRGMSLADLDNDGDLDVIVNNLLAPAKVFENRLCAGDSLAVDLRWLGVANSHGLGATLVLQTDQGNFRRDLQAVSGYLSGDSSRAHFGFPAGSQPQRLTITWSDGAVSLVDAPQPNTLLTILRE